MDRIDAEFATPSSQAVHSLASVEGTILVLGAGGKMGLHLCLHIQQALQRQGKSNQLYAVSRFHSLTSREDFESRRIDSLPCDLSEEEQVAKLPDAGLVFYLAGVKFGTASSPELLWRMNVEAPRLVAQRYATSTIVALSTGCVYPFVPVDSGGSVETDEPAPVGDYAESCVGREKAFIEISGQHGTPVSIIRLNYSTEYRYGVLVDVAEKVYHERPIDLSMGYLNAIWQSDAISGIICSHAHASSPPLILNLTGPDTISIRELAHRFGELFGKTPIFTGRENRTAWLSNASKFHRLLGRPSVSYDEMVSRTAEWIQAGGSTYGKPTHFENRDGKF